MEKPTKVEQTLIYLPIRKALNIEAEQQIVSYGQIESNAEIDVVFEVQGKLESGTSLLKPGSIFTKGQTLYRVNNEEAAYSLNSRKSQLANLVVGIMPDIELDFPNEKAKWSQFLEKIQPNKSLPNLPEAKNSKERMFLTTRGVVSEYYNIKSLESRLEKYNYIAPFSGTVIDTYAEPGSVASPGGRIARIAKTNDYEVTVPIAIEFLKLFQKQSSVNFSTVDGKIVGSGKIERISEIINQQTQSVDVYYSIQSKSGQKLYAGMYLNAAINQQAVARTFTVPNIAVSDNSVSVLKGNLIATVPISVVGSKPDSLLVSGIPDGSLVILEKIEVDRKGKKFKGILR